MSANLGTRIIDGDGHIMEDNAAIIAHMEGSYREIAARKGICFPPLDHIHAGRAVETPPQRDQRPAVGPQGWIDFLDDVGIEWSVLYPTVALSYGKIVSRDYAVVMTLTALIAVVVVFMNFLVDMLYVVLDPRIRRARALA